MNRTLYPVVLESVPAADFDAAVSYLADVLRECQLTLVGEVEGARSDPELVGLARALVPDLEELREIFRAAEIATDAGRARIDAEMRMADAAMLAHLQSRLVQLRYLGRRGTTLVVSEPAITRLLAWIWDEAADQLHGRAPRPHPA